MPGRRVVAQELWEAWLLIQRPQLRDIECRHKKFEPVDRIHGWIDQLLANGGTLKQAREVWLNGIKHMSPSHYTRLLTGTPDQAPLIEPVPPPPKPAPVVRQPGVIFDGKPQPPASAQLEEIDRRGPPKQDFLKGHWERNRERAEAKARRRAKLPR